MGGDIDVAAIDKRNPCQVITAVDHHPSVLCEHERDRPDGSRPPRAGVDPHDSCAANRASKGLDAGVTWRGGRRVETKLITSALYVFANAIGKGFQELAARAIGGGSHTQIIEHGDRARQNDGHRFGLVRVQPGQAGAIIEAELNAD